MKKIFLLLGIFLVIGSLLLYSLPSRSQEGEGDEEAEYPTYPIIFTKPLKAVLFDHKIHVEEAGLSCEDCHEELFPQEAGSTQENKDFDMNALYNGKYCGACHDGEMAFSSNTRCATCHIGVLGLKRLSQQESQNKSEEH